MKVINRFLALALCASLLGCQSAPEDEAVPESAAEAAAEAQKTPVSRETTVGPVHAVVTLSHENPRLGEQVELVVRVDAAPEIKITMPEFGDQLGKFGIANYQSTEGVLEDGRNVYTQTYLLDLPMSGRLRTPSFLVEFVDNRPGSGQENKVQELLTEEISFDVSSVFEDGKVPEELAPPAEALGELVIPGPRNNMYWIWILAGLIVIGGAGLVIWKKVHSKKEIVLPPDVVALSEIASMEAEEIPTDSKLVDAWYVRLSSVVRNYIEGRFDMHAPRLTTEEFFELAKSSDALSDQDKQLIRKLLERSDRVKFTDFVPTVEESREMLADARRFVEETRIVEQADTKQ